MIEELRRVELELDSNRTNLNLLERYIVLSKRLGRDSIKDWFPLDFYEIEKFFNKNKILIEKYIELQNRYSFGYPARNAFFMVRYYESDMSWGERVIENCQIGDPSRSAYLMVRYCNSDRKWAEKVIENCQIGNPARAAYDMVLNSGSDRIWAEKVIENAKIGNPAYAAELMVDDFGSDRSWAEKVIEKAKVWRSK